MQQDRRLQQLRRLSEVTRTLTYAASEDETLEVAIKEAAALLGTHNVAIALCDGDGVSIRASAALRLRAQQELRRGFEALDEAALARLRALLAEDDDSLFLAVPMVIDGEVAGVLAVARAPDAERNLEDHEWLLSAIADQAAVSVERLRSHQSAEAAHRLRRQREEQFQNLYDSPLLGLVFRNREGLVVDANDAFLALVGYTRDEVTAGALRWEALDARTPTSGKPIETEIKRKDGQRAEVLLGSAILSEQECDLVFVVDIAAQKRGEMSLRLLSETSKALLGASLDYEALFRSIAWLVVPRFADWCAVESVEDGATIGRNVALESVSSRHVEDALEWRRRYPPNPKSKVGVAEVIRSGRSQLHSEIGERFLAEYTCESTHPSELRRTGLRSAILVPMFLHGRVVGVLTFVRAATRRRFDAQDLRLAEEISRRAASAVENARLYHRAQEAVGLRDEFLAVAAHELKTPLTTLQLQLDVLQRSIDVVCADDQKMARRLQSAGRQVERLTRLVSDLVNVSRISAGQIALNREPCDLVELVRGVVHQFEAQARATHTIIRTELPSSAVRGSWDRIRIEQIVASLLSNALKYGAGKPVRVAVSADSMARLSVKDEGIGIAPADTSRIFDRFERAVTTHHYSGLGIGLFIARQVAEAHGGDIRVLSRPGAGAEFIVQLPMLMAADDQLAEERP